MKTFLVAALALSTVGGCVSAKVSEPSACDGQALSFPTPAVPSIPSEYDSTAACSGFSLTIPQVSTTTTLNLSTCQSK